VLPKAGKGNFRGELGLRNYPLEATARQKGKEKKSLNSKKHSGPNNFIRKEGRHRVERSGVPRGRIPINSPMFLTNEKTKNLAKGQE